MKIEPPADDLGLQHLKTTDRAKGKVAEVDHVERYARIAPSEERRDGPRAGVDMAPDKAGAPSPHEPQPRHGERRSGGDRRRRHAPTLLDTRSPHERRTELRRAADQATPHEHPPAGGIDELA